MRQTMLSAALGAALLALIGLPATAQTPPTAPPPAPGTTQPAPEQAPTPTAAEATPTNYGIQYNGLVDAYYLFNFNNPKDTAFGGHTYYDTRHNSPALSLAELNVFKNAKPGGLGWKATLITGDTADINHNVYNSGNSTLGEARWKNVQQLYGTYAFSGAGGGIDFGKYYTPFGYEVTESNGNYNYSRSLPFNLLPIYHFGVRAYTPSRNGLTLTGYLFRALFNTQEAGVQDDNGQLAGAVQINWTPTGGKYTLIENFGYGKDKLGASNVTAGGINTKSTLSDTDFTYTLSPSSTLGLNYVYLETKPDDLATTRTNGYAVYYRHQLSAKNAYALRFSGFDSHTSEDGVANTRPYEFTATYETKPATNLLTRFEYRHDNANGKGVQPFPGGSETSTPHSNQDTVSVSGVFTF